MSVVLRALRAESLDSALCFVRSYFEHDGLDFNDAVARGVEQLLGDPALGWFWVIETDGVDVGYIVLTYGFDHEFGGRIGVITDFFLFESARGQGLGARVLSLVESEAISRGLNGLELFVLEHNGRASRFYESLGFEKLTDRTSLWKSLP